MNSEKLLDIARKLGVLKGSFRNLDITELEDAISVLETLTWAVDSLVDEIHAIGKDADERLSALEYGQEMPE